MKRQIVGPACGLLAATALMAGCSATKVGSSVSPCFRVLPQAHAAVAGQGAFVDVVRIRGRQSAAFAGPQRPSPSSGSTSPGSSAPADGDSRRDVCVVGYRGSFDATMIPGLEGPQRQGSYAVVVVGVRSQHVRHVFLTDRLPSPLRRH